MGFAFGAGNVRERFDRRVSWTPGAEGAPGVSVVAAGWADVGTMRSDCLENAVS